MSAPGHHSTVRSLVAAMAFVCVAAGSLSLVSAQDKGAPPWGEFLKKFEKDRLLKKPFHMDPEEGVKGLASKIRARELDIPNRKKAIRYLQDLDCVQFPEAKLMLLSLLNPEEEKWEEVRFEAARGLRNMLAQHSCNPDAAKGKGKDNGKDKGKSKEGGSGKCQTGNCPQATSCNSCNDSAWQQCCQAASNVSKKVRGERTKDQDPPCHCTSCCDAETLNTLAKTAYEMKENGCCYEPSLRVREMAVEAIKACGVPCHYKPYYGEFEEPGPPAWDEASGQMRSGDGEAVPPATNEGTPEPPPSPETTFAPLSLPAVSSVATPISRLTNLCIVSLTHGQRIKPDPKFSAVHRGRTYYFGSEEARQEFVASPEQFAVAFGGCDPVHYVETQQAVEGRYLAQHEGRYYMFATQENHQTFKSNPARYSLKTDTRRVASSN